MLNIIWNCVFGFFCNWFIFLLGNCVSNSVIGTLTLCSATTRAGFGRGWGGWCLFGVENRLGLTLPAPRWQVTSLEVVELDGVVPRMALWDLCSPGQIWEAHGGSLWGLL